jgi:hypothetical protein
MLVYHADAQFQGVFGGIDMYRDAFQQHVTTILPIESVQDIHQGGFAGSVFTEKSVDLTFFRHKGYMIVGDDSGKALHDVI